MFISVLSSTSSKAASGPINRGTNGINTPAQLTTSISTALTDKMVLGATPPPLE